MDKKDLEELEKWKKQKMNYVETYGIDIFHKKKKTKKAKIAERLFKLTYKIAKTLLIILAFLIIILTFAILFWYYNYIYERLHAQPIKVLSGMYNKHIETVSSNTDEDGNGSYKLTVKENSEIIFNVFVNWSEMQEDYSDQCQKYYFNKWQNSEKSKLITEETYNENGILTYSQYIEVQTEEEVQNAVNLLYAFIESTENMFFPDWNLYLKVENQRIYPFYSTNYTKEQALEYSKEQFNKIMSNLGEVQKESEELQNIENSISF